MVRVTEIRKRVMVAGDWPTARLGLTRLIEKQKDQHVIGQVAGPMAAMDLWGREYPDAGVLHFARPSITVETIRRIRQVDPGARIVVFGSHVFDTTLYDALRAGARGLLVAQSPRDHVQECLRAVLCGRSWASPEIARALAVQDRLTPREVEVLALAARGHTNDEIADRLRLCKATAKHDLTRAVSKLAARDRTQAVVRALSRRLIDLAPPPPAAAWREA